MAATRLSKVFGSLQAKVSKVTDDPSGGTTTYASSVTLPGIRDVLISGPGSEALLEGDNTLLDVDSWIDRINVEIEWAKRNLDAQAVFTNVALADSGTGTAEIVTATYSTPILFNYFMLEVRSASADPVGGDAYYKVLKCKALGLPEMGTVHRAYKYPKVTCIAVPRLSDGKWVEESIRETAAVIS